MRERCRSTNWRLSYWGSDERTLRPPSCSRLPRHPDRPQNDIWAAWKTIKKKAGLPPTLRLHDLRHTYASHALLAGESLYVAGKLLGHRKVRSTQIYAHLDGGKAARAADRIAKEIAGLMIGEI